MKGLGTDHNWNIPMGLGREAENVDFLGGVKGLRNQVVWHVLPQKVLESAYIGLIDGVHTVDHHAEMSGKVTETKGIISPANGSTVVQVKAGWNASIGWSNVRIGIDNGLSAILANGHVVSLEKPDGRSVVIKLVDQQDVGSQSLNDFGNDRRLGCSRGRQFRDELSSGVAVQGRVVGHEANHTLNHRSGAGEEEEERRELHLSERVERLFQL